MTALNLYFQNQKETHEVNYLTNITGFSKKVEITLIETCSIHFTFAKHLAYLLQVISYEISHKNGHNFL